MKFLGKRDKLNVYVYEIYEVKLFARNILW